MSKHAMRTGFDSCAALDSTSGLSFSWKRLYASLGPAAITTIFADTCVLSDSVTSHLEEEEAPPPTSVVLLSTLVTFFPITICPLCSLAAFHSPSTSVCHPPSTYMVPPKLAK